MPKQQVGGGGGGGSSPGGVSVPQSGVVFDPARPVEIVVQAGVRLTTYSEQNRIELAPGFEDEAWGDIMFRGASGWQRLPAGTAGQKLQTNGPGADPSWVT